MPDGYSSHRDYIAQVSADADKRKVTIEAALREAFAGYIEKREVEVILFLF